jgi:hypothetical protein
MKIKSLLTYAMPFLVFSSSAFAASTAMTAEDYLALAKESMMEARDQAETACTEGATLNIVTAANLAAQEAAQQARGYADEVAFLEPDTADATEPSTTTVDVPEEEEDPIIFVAPTEIGPILPGSTGGPGSLPGGFPRGPGGGLDLDSLGDFKDSTIEVTADETTMEF